VARRRVRGLGDNVQTLFDAGSATVTVSGFGVLLAL
jgi:hypothetical protein